MAWVRIDDSFAQHPKLAKAGPLAMAMQIAALCYCNRNLTDGFVPRAIARTLLDWEVVESSGRVCTLAYTSGMAGNDVTSEWVIGILVESGMWIERANGYQIHDYLEYQPSASEVKEQREKTKTRVNQWRNNKRRENDAPESNSHCNAVTNGSVTPAPVPDPDPLPNIKKEKEEARQEPRAEVLPPEPDPRRAIFADGLRWLASSTKREERALRPLVGKWIKARGDPEVAAAMVAAQQVKPVDPIAWIEARLKSNAQRKPSDLDNRRATVEAIDEVVAMAEARQRGLGG